MSIEDVPRCVQKVRVVRKPIVGESDATILVDVVRGPDVDVVSLCHGVWLEAERRCR
jgi:hypothetical protein